MKKKNWPERDSIQRPPNHQSYTLPTTVRNLYDISASGGYGCKLKKIYQLAIVMSAELNTLNVQVLFQIFFCRFMTLN